MSPGQEGGRQTTFIIRPPPTWVVLLVVLLVGAVVATASAGLSSGRLRDAPRPLQRRPPTGPNTPNQRGGVKGQTNYL